MNEAMKTAWLEISQMLGEPTREELDVFLRTWQRAIQAEREKYEAIIASMTKLLEAQQKRESVAVDMIAAGMAAEREECAKICDAWQEWGADGALLAKAIRARGQA
jgi:hypothetical protein